MNPKLCNICGERPRSKNQGTCSQCRWKKHSAKQTKRIATPEYKEQLKQWRRTRTISDAAKQREIRHRANYAAKYPDKERAKWLQRAERLRFELEKIAWMDEFLDADGAKAMMNIAREAINNDN